MHGGEGRLFEQLEREGQKEVENPGKGSRALKTKDIEDKVSFPLCVGKGLSSGSLRFQRFKVYGQLTLLTGRRDGCVDSFFIQNLTESHQGGA